MRAVEDIPMNSYVCEYAGEIIDEKEEKKRYPRSVFIYPCLLILCADLLHVCCVCVCQFVDVVA